MVKFFQYKLKIFIFLIKADVVFSTINDCFIFYEKGHIFDVCIIFESNRFTDAELMIPLLSQPKKLILAGDNYMLRPKVRSVVLKNMIDKSEFQQSLFSRMVHYHKHHNGGSPVYFLNKQFRMHPHISNYIRTEVYGYQLIDSDSAQTRKFFLKRKFNLLLIFNFL